MHQPPRLGLALDEEGRIVAVTPIGDDHELHGSSASALGRRQTEYLPRFSVWK